MGAIKSLFGFLLSRTFWSLVALLLLCALIWLYGPLVSVGQAVPLGGELARLVVIGLVLIAWLVWLLVKQIRALRANRLFVTELAQPAPAPSAPGEENVEEINAKFAGVLDRMKRSKLGGRRFLREMPWYVIIGPPGTGKTTALRQSGLDFPVDPTDDLHGVGGTRNCDWYFTDEAVLIDTAGRYVEQASDPEVDAAEWRGFLDLLRKHRGRRALNGVVVALSVQELLGEDAELRRHGVEIRRRLAELGEALGIRLPVYLMVTKVDLIPGFEAFFGGLSMREREQVWGASLPVEARVDGVAISREARTLTGALEDRLVERLSTDAPLDERAAAFRFPAQMERLTGRLRRLVETTFGESRYDEAPWLRGFYLTSATQEGSPVDRLVGEMAADLGLSAPPPPRRAHGEKRSFFLHDLLTELIFPEAGLGSFDPRAEERRLWARRGTWAGATLATAVGALVFLTSYLGFSGAIASQSERFGALHADLGQTSERQQAMADPEDLAVAVNAVSRAAAARADAPDGPLAAIGPSAGAELARAQQIAYEKALRDVLEPRMVALLEATMWRHIRDPDYLLGALKAYRMLTGEAPYDAEFVAAWWGGSLPGRAPIEPFPTDEARRHQLAALDRMSDAEERIGPDPELLDAALETVCEVPLAVRAYRELLEAPEVAALPDWVPAEVAGPNGAQVLTRLSGETLRVGLPGAFTYKGFHGVVLPLVRPIAQAAADERSVFAGGCRESAEATAETLEADILKLYYDEFVARWDAFLRDVRLAPFDDLETALSHLEDLSSEDSALSRLLFGVVAETHLTRVDEAEETSAAPVTPKSPGFLRKFARQGSRLIELTDRDDPAGPPPGEPVAEHFAPLRAMVEEVDGQPPLIGDVTAALAALFNELQLKMAPGRPGDDLAASDALRELTGVIAIEAGRLPDPMDDWIAGVASDTMAATQEAVRKRLDAIYRAEIQPFCIAATSGRYPFAPSSSIDVTLQDFARLLGPGGLFDAFATEHLVPHIDTTTGPWGWREGFDIPAQPLEAFRHARAMRDALFVNGDGPKMSFTLTPGDLRDANDPNRFPRRATLDIDGQPLLHDHGFALMKRMEWPRPDGTNLVTLSITSPDGSREEIATKTGSWAFLRLLRDGRLIPSEVSGSYDLTLRAGSYSASYRLEAHSVENPFDLAMFEGFVCPEGF